MTAPFTYSPRFQEPAEPAPVARRDLTVRTTIRMPERWIEEQDVTVDVTVDTLSGFLDWEVIAISADHPVYLTLYAAIAEPALQTLFRDMVRYLARDEAFETAVSDAAYAEGIAA